jgi:hypothetical protein
VYHRVSPGITEPREGITLEDVQELVKLLGTRFIQRKDVKAFQKADGSWYPKKCEPCRQAQINCGHSPMTMADFEAHLSGKVTMGHYLVNPVDQSCKLFAFDLDVRKPDPKVNYDPRDYNGQPYNPREAILDENHVMYRELIIQLRSLAEGLAVRLNNTLDIPVAIAYSGGKGFHVYAFTGTIPAATAQQLATDFMYSWSCFTPSRGENFWKHVNPDCYQELEIETFPKQGSVDESGFGTLMSLPLGVNQKTGRKKFFISTRSELDRVLPMDPIFALEGDLPWE